MGLFGRGSNRSSDKPEIHPLTARVIYCRICDAERPFTRCWHRVRMVAQCPCCGLVFEDPRALYARFQPMCPRCEEPLESPGFDYGVCDVCHSKYEIIEGAKPGLLPNLQQRKEMAKYGHARPIE
jgi:hypothetical protein